MLALAALEYVVILAQLFYRALDRGDGCARVVGKIFKRGKELKSFKAEGIYRRVNEQRRARKTEHLGHKTLNREACVCCFFYHLLFIFRGLFLPFVLEISAERSNSLRQRHSNTWENICKYGLG